MGGPLRKDGQPDMRYKSNRESGSSISYVVQKSASITNNFYSSDNDRYNRNPPGPLRKDGQPDMRYAANKKYVAENNVKIPERTPIRITKATDPSVPLRKDGQPSMRNKVEKELTTPGPLRKDGQLLDMRYAANKKYVAERNANKVVANKKSVENVKEKEIVNVKFGLVNAQSLLSKAGKLKEKIASSNYDIVAVTETWTTWADDSDLKVACPEGFKAVHQRRKGQRGGGVAIFYRDSIEITVHSLKDYKSFEYLDVSLDIGGDKDIRLLNIYRPSGKSKVEFLEEFQRLLRASGGGNRKLLITGDFNLHIENPDKNDRAFLKLIKSHGLEQHVKKSTHEKGGILDLIMTQQSDSLVKNVQVGEYFSDHKFVQCTIQIEKKKEDTFEREE